MPKKILLADDSITIQKVITITFASEDYAITVVGDGDNAVKKAKELKPDLILADVAMPGKSGYEVCDAVKTDPALRHIPVMLLAGTFEPLNKNEAQRVKADESIVKPFESQELIDKVAALLAKAAPAAEEEIAELEPAEIALEPEPFVETPKVQAPSALERPAAPPLPTPPRISPPPPPKAPSYKAPELDIEPTTEALFGPSDDFLGMEEEPAPPPKAPPPPAATKAPLPKEELGIGAEGGFMDLELSEEELKPKPLSAPIARPTAPPAPPPPPARPAAPPPPKPPAAPSFEPEPYSFAPPEEEKEAFTPTFEPEKAEPFELGSPSPIEPATGADESFWAEPAPIPAPKVPEAVKAPPPETAKKPVEPVRPAPEVKPAGVAAPSFALREAQASKVADVVQRAAEQAEQRVRQGAAEMLRGLKEPKEKVDDAIFKITRTVIEEVAWEVVPALAEELLSAEIRKFKDAWAKAK